MVFTEVTKFCFWVDKVKITYERFCSMEYFITFISILNVCT